MDDRDLEARLEAHLHRRFDDAQPSQDLVHGVGQVFATRPRGLDLTVLGVRSPMRLGFSLTAAAAAIVLLAVAASNLGLHLGPSAGGGPSPSPSGPTERTFIVLPPSGSDATSKPQAIVAGDVLMARLRALGVGTFSMGGGYGMTFELPGLPGGGGPSDEAIRAVLGATGDVEFVPLPATDYGNGNFEAMIGQPLPKAETPLFNTPGLAAVSIGTSSGGAPALDLELTPAASRLVAQWTAAHVGDQLAIVIDGKVAELPIIEAPITGGTIQISNDAGPATETPVSWAILIGGMLPAAWQGAPVPIVISREAAIEAAVRTSQGAAESAQLDAMASSTGWQAVWNVVVGHFPTDCSSSGCLDPASTTETFVVDALNGAILTVELPAAS